MWEERIVELPRRSDALAGSMVLRTSRLKGPARDPFLSCIPLLMADESGL